MKLKKLKTIKDYKSFAEFSWHPFLNTEIFHNDANVLYGENGSGKTSICNILKSVSQHKDFEKYFPKEATLLFDNKDYKYENNVWDSNVNRGNILFFDKEFVDKHVQLGHDRGTQQGQQEQESGKIIIEFDSEAINLRDIRNKAKEARDQQEEKVKKIELDNKEDLDFKLSDDEEGLFKKLKNKTKEELKERKKNLDDNKKLLDNKIEVDKGTQEKVQEIQSDISEFDEDDFDYKVAISDKKNYQDLFDFELKEKTKITAEQALIDKLKEHKDFFEEGFDIRDRHPKQCPFCQSKDKETNIKHILGTYNQLYDDSYKKQRDKFSSTKQELLQEINEIETLLTDFNLGFVFLELKRLDESYKVKGIYSVKEERELKKPKLTKLKELNKKISELQKPSKEKIDVLYDAVADEVADIQKFFNDIEKLVEDKNKIIKKFKSDNTDKKVQERIKENITKLSNIEDELDFINNKKIEKENKRIAKDKVFQKESKTLEKLRDQYKQDREVYENYCSSSAFTNLLKKIEEYFKHFNFSFKLKLDTEKRRSGRTKEFPFAFKVLEPNGTERDFKEGLSEGEWQVLALCFFFAFLDIQKGKKSKILVFDDPITSLDNSNLSCLVDLIAKEKEKFSQTFIFTHHRTFFKFLRKRFSNGKCHEYNIVRNKKELGGSFICKSASEKFVQKLRDFESHLQALQSASVDMELKIVEYGQYLRYEVERFIKNDLLHWGAEGNFTLAIDGVKRNRSISDNDLDTISRVYSFCNWTTSHVDVGDDHGLGQLKEKINDFITVVDANHS